MDAPDPSFPPHQGDLLPRTVDTGNMQSSDSSNGMPTPLSTTSSTDSPMDSSEPANSTPPTDEGCDNNVNPVDAIDSTGPQPLIQPISAGLAACSGYRRWSDRLSKRNSVNYTDHTRALAAVDEIKSDADMSNPKIQVRKRKVRPQKAPAPSRKKKQPKTTAPTRKSGRAKTEQEHAPTEPAPAEPAPAEQSSSDKTADDLEDTDGGPERASSGDGALPSNTCERHLDPIPLQDISDDLTLEALEDLLHCSRAIMARFTIDRKPNPRGQPEVWSDSRQALCETILYYQAWQTASYMSKGVLYSFMFDSNGHSRDLIDGNVIIARAGGAMVRDRITKELYQSRDQRETSQTQAIRLAIMQQNPLVVFCGSENADIATKMPHRYNSLGWFKVTHAWSERTPGKAGTGSVVNIKYRFEKLGDYDSWWLPQGVGGHALDSFPPPITFTCPVCQQVSPQIYLQGWMCLQSECLRFWRLPSGLPPNHAELDYDCRFLKQKTAWACEQPPYSIRPDIPDPSTRLGDDKTYAMTRGLCCPRCGKCTPRYLWKGWYCSNPTCDFEHCPPLVSVPSSILRDPWHPISRWPAQSHDWIDAVVTAQVDFKYNYRVVTYRMAGLDGFICHLVANQTVIEEAKGPNGMFEAMQTLDCGLERSRFGTGTEDYMTAFSNNRGMPYKFIASGQSMPFEGAPWPLVEARSRLSWAARMTVGDDFEDAIQFNEMLTIGYLDGQNIKYHDDGEKGLGSTVASLSLGYPADMSFRIKLKHWTGMSKTGLLTEIDPLPCTPAYEARIAALAKIRGLEKGLVDAERLRRAAKDAGLQDHAKDRRPCIRLRLGHGDIVVMHGQQVQEYLEHQVDPLGTLRFAMTCRSVLPGHLRADELPAYRVLPDDGHYDGSGIAQDARGC